MLDITHTAKGMIALTFKKAASSLSFFDGMVAELNGVSFKTWSSHDVEEGPTYFCTTEDFIGRKYAKPAFKVLNLPKLGEETQVVSESARPTSLSLSDLAEKWGAKLQK